MKWTEKWLKRALYLHFVILGLPTQEFMDKLCKIVGNVIIRCCKRKTNFSKFIFHLNRVAPKVEKIVIG